MEPNTAHLCFDLIQMQLAENYFNSGNLFEAQKHGHAVLEYRQRCYGVFHPKTAEIRVWLINCLSIMRNNLLINAKLTGDAQAVRLLEPAPVITAEQMAIVTNDAKLGVLTAKLMMAVFGVLHYAAERRISSFMRIYFQKGRGVPSHDDAFTAFVQCFGIKRSSPQAMQAVYDTVKPIIKEIVDMGLSAPASECEHVKLNATSNCEIRVTFSDDCCVPTEVIQSALSLLNEMFSCEGKFDTCTEIKWKDFLTLFSYPQYRYIVSRELRDDRARYAVSTRYEFIYSIIGLFKLHYK